VKPAPPAGDAPAGRPPAIDAPGERRNTRLAALALVIVTLAAWLNSFSGPFVFDDRPAILANPTLDRLATALSPPRDGGTVAGRPLVNLSLAINRGISGTEVWSYHALNLLIHLLAGLTLFGLLRRTLRSLSVPHFIPIAFAGTLLWMVHPLQTAAVTYIVQRAESLMALCFLLTLYTFVRGTTPCPATPTARFRARTWLAGSVAACLAGMACKEVMVVAPLVVLLFDRTFVAGSFTAALRARLGYHSALAGTWLLLAWLVVKNSARAGTAGFEGHIAWTDYARTQFMALATYLKLAFWPRSLVFDYGTEIAPPLAAIWPQALMILVLAAATVIALWRRPAPGFLGAAFFLILAPSSSVVPIHTQTIAEHRMYLPLAAITCAAALALHGWLRRWMIGGVIAVALALGVATFDRNRVYHDALTLWTDTVAKRPANGRAHNNLGIELARAQRSTEAAAHFELALRSNPDDAEVHNNLGNVLAKLGRDADALAHFEHSARLNPASAAARLNLANALLRAGRAEDAVTHFEAAEHLAPLDADAHTSLGVALLQVGRLPSAIDRYRKAIALTPTHARGHYNLGLALARTGRYSESVTSFRECVRLEPNNVGARVNLGNVLLLTGRATEAVVEYEAALRLKPDDPQIRANLARAKASR
jgi:Flp pilus assembly protein TadD